LKKTLTSTARGV